MESGKFESSRKLGKHEKLPSSNLQKNISKCRCESINETYLRKPNPKRKKNNS